MLGNREFDFCCDSESWADHVCSLVLLRFNARRGWLGAVAIVFGEFGSSWCVLLCFGDFWC